MKLLATTVALGAAFFAALPLAHAQEKEVAIDFALSAGAQKISCNSAPLPLGKTQVPSRLKDARFYLQDLGLLRADGAVVPVQLAQNEWQYLNVALVDLEDGQGLCAGNAATHSRVTGRVPAGNYVGAQFTVGVPVTASGRDGQPVSLNHSNTEQIAAPLDVQAMAWNWQAGRKFMKVEVAPEGGISRKNDNVKVWTVHLGSTGCVGNAANGETITCSNPNRFPVHFARFDLDQERVLLDVAELFKNADLRRDEGGASGCMSSPQDPECPAIFDQLGLRLTPSSTEAKDGGQPLPGFATPVFRKENKS